MRVAVIADTHLPSLLRDLDQLGQQVREALSTAGLILHAGDVTSPAVLDWCEQFAPVLAARGNHDTADDPRFADQQFVDIEGWRIGMVHELRPETRPIQAMLDERLNGERVDILIGGDTHVERLEYREGTLLLNPGSPILPHHLETRLGTLALLDFSRSHVAAEIVLLGETEGRRNPCTPYQLEVRR